MRIIVSGARGFLGSALVPALRADGHEVVPLVRSLAGPDPGAPISQSARCARSGGHAGSETGAPVPGESIAWQPDTGILDPERLGNCDAVIHLAGENIAGARWTPSFQARLRASRVGPTRRLAEALARLPRPPAVFMCASATGLYGSRGDESLTEDSPPGAGFLAELGRDWEAAAEPARAAGLRVVHLRFGVILGAGGGALARMLPVFRAGLGGRLGSGRQWWPWLALEDAVGLVRFVLDRSDLAGPLNAVAPGLVTNAGFTRELGLALGRPAVLPVPAWALRLALGRLADDALLASQRVVPRRLLEAGFPFARPDLAGALRAALARPAGLSRGTPE